MGSPNFGAEWCGIGGAFGLVPAYPSDEVAESAKETYGWDDWDLDEVKRQLFEDENDAVVYEREQIVPRIQDVVRQVVNRLWRFDYVKNGYGIEFPYEVRCELGYHTGWRVVLASRYCDPHEPDETWWRAWCDLIQRPSEDPEEVWGFNADAPRIDYGDFCRHVEKVSDAVVWAFEMTARSLFLQYIIGGWTGGEREPQADDYTEIVWREKWEQMFPTLIPRVMHLPDNQ